MLKFSYSDIVKKIQDEKGISKTEIEEKIKDKIKQLSDLVSLEGAAHIVANQLGVKLFESFDNRKLKIKEIPRGASAISVIGRVIDFWGIKDFNKNGRAGRVANFLMGDETGAIRIVVWDEPVIDKINNLKEGDIVQIKNAYSKENRGYIELHLGSRSELNINPEGENVGEITVKLSIPVSVKKNIKDLNVGDEAELFGTIVRLFDPNFYFVCPYCIRKAVNVDGKFNCNEHGEVEAKKAPVINLFFDDGTESIRAVVFAQQARELTEINFDEDYDLENIKKELLGKQIILIGKATRNQINDRLEFIVRQVKEVDPLELIDELKNDV